MTYQELLDDSMKEHDLSAFDVVLTEALRRVSSQHPRWRVSIGGPAECSICLQWYDGWWTVYESERGGFFDVVRYKILFDAIEEVLSRVTDNQGAAMFARAELLKAVDEVLESMR